MMAIVIYFKLNALEGWEYALENFYRHFTSPFTSIGYYFYLFFYNITIIEYFVYSLELIKFSKI